MVELGRRRARGGSGGLGRPVRWLGDGNRSSSVAIGPWHLETRDEVAGDICQSRMVEQWHCRERPFDLSTRIYDFDGAKRYQDGWFC